MLRTVFKLLLTLALIAHGSAFAMPAPAAPAEPCQHCPQGHAAATKCPCCPDSPAQHGCVQSCDGCCSVLAAADSVDAISLMPLARVPIRTLPLLRGRAVLPDDRPPIA